MIRRDVASTLRAVSALRALCLRLPHLPTPAETARLRRFQELVVSPHSATDDDIEAIAAGWRGWWRSGQADRVRAMAEALPAGLMDRDRRLAAYARATRLA
jgi:hypothetical protein